MKKGFSDPVLIGAVAVLLIVIVFVALNLSSPVSKKGIPIPVNHFDEIKGEDLAVVLDYCNDLCAQINDDASERQFCSSFINSSGESPLVVNGFLSCPKKIPCFLVVPNCQEKYSPAYCKSILTNHSELNNIVQNLGSNDITPDDGCAMPAGGGSNQKNWKTELGFTSESFPTGS